MKRASPLFRYLPGCCVVVAWSLAAPTGLSAQPRAVDLEDRQPPPSERRVEVPPVAFQVDHRFRRQTWAAPVRNPTDTVSPMPRARLSGAARPMTPTSEPLEQAAVARVVTPTQNLRFQRQREDWSPTVNRRPLLLAPLVRNAEVAPDFLSAMQFQQMVDEISMADINRFQFHRNHSQEPGIPEVPAGGGPPP